MTQSPEPELTPHEVLRLADEARAHDAREVLSAFAFDLLTRQAEGQTLFAGREFVDKRADAHGVDRDAATCASGNLLTIAERGPTNAIERGLVAAFAVLGFVDALEADEDSDALTARFVEHITWLEVATPYAMYRFVAEILPASHAGTVWARVADAVIADEANGPGRARSAARLTALASLGTDAESGAVRHLERVRDESKDASVSAMAGSFLESATSSSTGDIEAASREPSSGVTVEGDCVGLPLRRVWVILRVVTGWALLAWLARGLGRIVGFRERATLTLCRDGVRMERQVKLLGRAIVDEKQMHAWGAVLGASRVSRYPFIHVLVGLLSLGLGVIFGGLYLFDGVRGGDTVVLVAGAVVIVLGGGLDLLLSVFIPGRRAKVGVDVWVKPGRAIRLAGIPLADAERFVSRATRRLPH